MRGGGRWRRRKLADRRSAAADGGHLTSDRGRRASRTRLSTPPREEECEYKDFNIWHEMWLNMLSAHVSM